MGFFSPSAGSVLFAPCAGIQVSDGFHGAECPGGIACLWESSAPVPTRISQCLVSDKTFPNPLIYQMANPVNSLRNIITCNLFCYSFSACTSLPWQLPRSRAGAAASALQFPLQWQPRCSQGLCLPAGGCRTQEGGRQQLGAAFQALAALEELIPLDGGNIMDQDLLLGWKKSQPDFLE